MAEGVLGNDGREYELTGNVIFPHRSGLFLAKKQEIWPGHRKKMEPRRS